jgi:hypothetical protein
VREKTAGGSNFTLIEMVLAHRMRVRLGLE